MNTKNKQKITEKEETPTVLVQKNELPQMIQKLKGQKVNILPVNEMDGVIEPQDRTTIQYLSNIKHPETGEITQPFTIGGKKYQMVRGITSEKNIVMCVYCFNVMDDTGNNMIYHVDEFENKVAKPVFEMEKLTNEAEGKYLQPSQSESLNLGEYKHFIVNEKNGKFKKFKTTPELAATTMLENEKYMGLYEFKKFFEYRVFGVPKKKITTKTEVQQQTVTENRVVKTIKKKDIK